MAHKKEPDTFTDEQMRRFVERWEPKHKAGRGMYIFNSLITPVVMFYVIVLGFILPYVFSGYSLAYLYDPNFYVQFIIPFLVALACAYYAGILLWKQNEAKYRAFETVLERYSAAWDWILEEQKEKQRQAEAKKKNRKRNKGEKR